MIILSVDTSTDSLSVSLISERKILAEYNSIGSLRHSALLVPTIQKALKKTHTKIGGIDLFSVGIGPGSFTGLRIGVTAIRALAIALKKPVIGVPAMDAIAYNGLAYLEKKKSIDGNIKICPILDAKKGKIYACIYSSGGGKIIRKTNYLLESAERLVRRLKGEVIFLGDGISLYKDSLLSKKSLKALFLEGTSWLPKASVIAKMALDKYKNGKKDNPYDLVPLYLYARDCQVRYGKKVHSPLRGGSAPLRTPRSTVDRLKMKSTSKK